MTNVTWDKTVLFDNSPAEALDRVRTLVRQESYHAGNVIFNEGDEANDVYLLKSGEVELTYTLPTRRDTTVHITTIHPGGLFAWSALANGKTLTARAYAIHDTEVFRIRATALRMVMDEIPEFGYQVMNTLSFIIAKRLKDTRTQLQWLHSI